jgi:nucleotide-binding universal stress UspA family protein
MPLQRILCPVDLSDSSAAAAAQAAALGRTHRATVAYLHVIEVNLQPGTLVPLPLVDLDRLQEDLAKALGDFLDQAAGPDASREEIVKVGPAVATILQEAEHRHADLIVIGTRGRSGLKQMVLGSTAERVVEYAPSPVLTVPPGAAEAARRAAGAFRRILCATDFSDTARAALDLAVQVAAASDGDLLLLHVVETLTEEEARMVAHYRVAEYIQYRREDALERLRAVAAALVPDHAGAGPHSETASAAREPQVRIELGAPAKIILEVAKETGADLIAMGRQGRGGLALEWFGSTTQTVVRRAQCPVLTTSYTAMKNEK